MSKPAIGSLHENKLQEILNRASTTALQMTKVALECLVCNHLTKVEDITTHM
jgi:hypothetical protein